MPTFYLNTDEPHNPTITSEPEGDIDEGDELTLTCHLSHVNPIPKLVWYRLQSGAVEVKPTDYNNATTWDGETTNMIELEPTYRDHGISYECRASNVMSQGPASSSIALYVRRKYTHR